MCDAFETSEGPPPEVRWTSMPAQDDIHTASGVLARSRAASVKRSRMLVVSGSGYCSTPRTVATHRLPSRSTSMAPPPGRPCCVAIVSCRPPGGILTSLPS